ncbi:MAG: hypothetical protein WAL56_20795 [Candidatus Sulfotelmatobacter sp.]
MKTRLESIMQAEERRADKVRELNVLLQDADIADYVAKLFGEPISGNSVPQQAPTNGNGQSLQNLTLTPAIKFIAENLPNRFQVGDVVKKMQDGGFVFGKRDPATAVRDSIYFLCRGESPIFRVAIKGEGGKPNTYERI